MTVLPRRIAIAVFLAFAFAYFLSALIRAITATLAPVLTQEFALQARDLGLLAGGYFLGFAATQLPLGTWLDQYGPKRVLICFLSVAVFGCLAFSMASSFSGLLAARILCGVGVSACLMAPLTGYRRWFVPSIQTRTNAWMLMTGSLGMVASTLPVQWLVPQFGWRALFVGVAGLLLLAIAMIAWRVPATTRPRAEVDLAASRASYAQVWRHPYFRRMAPLGFFCYGGLLAVQTLWAAPWMEMVAHYSPLQAAAGLFWINVSMLCAFWTWGMVGPTLARHGATADRLITWGLPISFVVLAVLIAFPQQRLVSSATMLALYCVACSFVTPSQPSVAMAFAPEVAGRALTSFNLLIFLGVFALQWGIGLAIDALMALGWSQLASYRLAFAAFLGCTMGAYVYFLFGARDNQVS